MPMRERALLFCCQHVLGMGSLVRSLALARALAQEFRVVFLTGGLVPRGLPRPRGVAIVDMPPLGFDGGGHLVPRDNGRSLERALRERREIILGTFRRLQPRAVVVELFPFGRSEFAGELLPLIDEAHGLGPHRPLIVSSLQDFLTTGRPDQVTHDERACALANRYLDAVLVHTDPRFARLGESFRPTRPLRVPVCYTGFVAAEAPRLPPGPRDRHLVVSAGGGRLGGPLLRAAVEAHPLLWRHEHLPTTLIAGPFLPEEEWRALAECARGLEGLRLRRSVRDLARELAGATASLSQCGYNTALDIVRTRVAALVVPSSEAGHEVQWVRARRFEQLGALRVLEPERLDGRTVAAELGKLLRFRPAPIPFEVGGAQRTVALVDEMLGGTRLARVATGGE